MMSRGWKFGSLFSNQEGHTMLDFFRVKKIPKLFWSSQKTFTLRPRPICLLMLIIGLTLFGVGEAFLIASSVGVSPWTVLADGIAKLMGWSIGFSTLVVSSSVLLLWFPLRQIPGIGTVLNILIVAFVIEVAHPKLPQFENQALQIMEAFIGVLITGIGGGIYLIANLGPGPRDGLMTGLQKYSNLPLAVVRTAIEVFVVALGWVLGGVAGVGTLLFAFGIGPAVALGLYLVGKFFN